MRPILGVLLIVAVVMGFALSSSADRALRSSRQEFDEPVSETRVLHTELSG
jgi:hypothetical protein